MPSYAVFQVTITFILLDPDVLPRRLFLNILSLCSSFSIKSQYHIRVTKRDYSQCAVWT